MANTAAYPQAVQRTIGFFSRLPGIGKRTAERLALALLEWPENDLGQFGEQVAELRQQVSACLICGNLSDGDTCAVCSAPGRQTDVICVVETPAQIPVFEKCGSYHGLYHVLGGCIAPLEGKGPEDLNVEALRRRLAEGSVRELIVATSPDVEGEATAVFLAREFADFEVSITRIASGVPVGADLSYADAATLSSALGGRRSLK